jgi:hypothetical protein
MVIFFSQGLRYRRINLYHAIWILLVATSKTFLYILKKQKETVKKVNMDTIKCNVAKLLVTETLEVQSNDLPVTGNSEENKTVWNVPTGR